MSAWRAFLTLFAASSSPIHQEIEDAIHRRREISRITARVHQAAQTSALDIITEQHTRTDVLDAWVKGQDTE